MDKTDTPPAIIRLPHASGARLLTERCNAVLQGIEEPIHQISRLIVEAAMHGRDSTNIELDDDGNTRDGEPVRRLIVARLRGAGYHVTW